MSRKAVQLDPALFCKIPTLYSASPQIESHRFGFWGKRPLSPRMGSKAPPPPPPPHRPRDCLPVWDGGPAGRWQFVTTHSRLDKWYHAQNCRDQDGRMDGRLAGWSSFLPPRMMKKWPKKNPSLRVRGIGTGLPVCESKYSSAAWSIRPQASSSQRWTHHRLAVSKIPHLHPARHQGRGAPVGNERIAIEK